MFAAGIVVGTIAAGALGESKRAAEAPDRQTRETEATEASPASALALTITEPAPSEPQGGEPGPDSEGSDIEARLQAMDAAWTEIRTEMDRLRGRVDTLARQLAGQEKPATPAAAARTGAPGPEERRSALVAAGVPEERAAEILWRQGQQELDRLELRDIAVREGWFGSDRYREELGLIDGEAVDLRREIGDEAYDRYLFATGADNRIQVVSVIPGSAAEDAGLMGGDIVESYDATRIFRFAELQGATVEGERGELVPLRIRRGGALVDVWLPRGPLGVRLDRASVDPDA